MLAKDENRPVPVGERLPPPRKRVIAVCPAFRCLGYLDDNNIWRHHSNNTEIKGVLAWMEQA